MRMCEWASLTGTDAGYGAPKSADCQGAPFSAAVQDDQRFARKWQKPAVLEVANDTHTPWKARGRLRRPN